MSETTTSPEDVRTRHLPRPVNAGVINSADRVGIGVLVLGFLAGLWLMVAPFLVGYQGRSSDWSNGTINIFVVGAGLAILALTTLIVFVAGILRDVSRRADEPGRRGQSPADPQLN